MKKAEVLHQPKKRSPYIAPNIHSDGHPLNMVLVEQFTYLGSIITNDVTSAKDVFKNKIKAKKSVLKILNLIFLSYKSSK